MKKPRLLQDQYPTRYLPHVGRQVMQGGGTPEGMFPRTQEEENIRANDLVNYAKQLDTREKMADVGEALGQTWPVRMAKGIMSGVTAPGDAYQGRLDPKSDEAIQRAMELAGATMLGGMPLGYQAGKQATAEGKALLGIFAGQTAKTADLEALKRAQEMAASGASRDDIWTQTGWFQGGDKNWRFEIPDRQTEYYFTQPSWLGDVPAGTVGAHVSHDALFAAYPELANIQHRSLDPNGKLRASFIRGDKPDLSDSMIEMYEPKGRMSSMLHELQHAIQNKEGWQEGANLDYGKAHARRELLDRYNEIGSKLTDTMNRQLQFPFNSPEYKKIGKEFKNITKESNAIYRTLKSRKAMDELGYEKYRNMVGEVEARNVQARAPLRSNELKNLPPWQTEDVPFEQQIFRPVKPKASGGSVVDKALMLSFRKGLPLPKPPSRQHGGRPRT